MHIGVAEVDITPTGALPLAGMPGFRTGRGVESPLTCRVVALDDGERRAALVSLDLLLMLSSTAAELREVMAEHGVDPSATLIACSHTHSAPYVASLMDGDPEPTYLDLLAERIGEATRRACAALAPATVRTGTATGSGLTFNRRPIYRTPREQVGTQGPQWTSEFVRIEGPTDEQAQFLWFGEDVGDGIGGIVNFACHPTVVAAAQSSKELYSPDFPGPLTEGLREAFGGPFGFLQGAAGQLWAVDTSRPDPPTQYGVSSARVMAEALVTLSRRAERGARTLEEPKIRAASRWLPIPQRTVSWKEVSLARAYLEKGEGRDDETAFTRAIYDHPYTFHSNSPVIQEWFCREAIGMWEWQRRATARPPLVEDVEIQVVTLGDVAFVGYPCELFTEHGLRTKRESPFRTTIVSELANGWFGYVPTVEAFAHGGYETRTGYQSRLDRTAGDLMVTAALELLNELASESDDVGGATV